jgi:hypothetical protein
MFELIKIMVEAITKSLSIKSITELRKSKRLTEIGTNLFIIYSALNNMLVVGREIVRELEIGLEWMERKIEEGEPEREFFTNLNFLLTQQSVNIVRLVRSLKDIKAELLLVAPDVYLNLAPLIHGKFNAISVLLAELSVRSSFPKLVSLSQDGLQKLEESQKRTRESHNIPRLNPFFDDGFLIAEPIENLSAIPTYKRDVIRKYLEERHPREVLAEIERAAEILREAIKENFSLQDILLKVGDDRAGVSETFIGFWNYGEFTLCKVAGPPCKKIDHVCRQPQKQVAKIVHCGLSGLHAALLGAYRATMLATRNDSQF